MEYPAAPNFGPQPGIPFPGPPAAGASSGRQWLAPTVTLIAVTALALALSGLWAFGRERVITGAAAPPGVIPGLPELFDPLPSQPEVLWRQDAVSLFGPAANVRFVVTSATSEDMIIVRGLPGFYGTAPTQAVAPDDGRLLWPGPSEFHTDACLFSLDNRLACIAYDGNNQNAPRQIGFLDPASGQLLSTIAITAPGYPTLHPGGNGFLIDSVNYGVDTEVLNRTLTWFSSDGARSWTHSVPTEYSHFDVSQAGGVVAAVDYDTGAQVLALESGDLLFNAETAEDETIFTATHAGGFAVNISKSATSGGDERIDFYDRTGAHTGDLTGWSFPFYVATEGDALPLSGEYNRLAVVDVVDRRLLWQRDDVNQSGVKIVDGSYLAVDGYLTSGKRYTLFDLLTGEPAASFEVSNLMTLRGFDGERVIFEGDDHIDDPGPGAITAIDVRTGQRVWRVKDTRSADDVNFRAGPRYLFQYDARTATSPALLFRLASPA